MLSGMEQHETAVKVTYTVIITTNNQMSLSVGGQWKDRLPYKRIYDVIVIL